jgi:hypothetical protein
LKTYRGRELSGCAFVFVLSHVNVACKGVRAMVIRSELRRPGARALRLIQFALSERLKRVLQKLLDLLLARVAADVVLRAGRSPTTES